MVGSALLLAIGVPFVAWLALPWPIAYRWVDPETTALMRYRIAQVERAGEPLALRHAWVPLGRISANVVRAVVAAEDGRFREHEGIDWVAVGEELRYRGEVPFSWTDPGDLRALVGAGRYYLRNRSEVRGRSTITQQLAKNLYFTPERSLARKAAELFIARRLERFLGKDRILELYLNTVELGPGIFGSEAAAREYFGVSAAELTTFQAASLAGTLPHPHTSNPADRPGRMAWRRDLILQRLRGGTRDRSPIPVAPEPITLPEDIRIEAPDFGTPEPPLESPPEEATEEVQEGATEEPGEPGVEPSPAPVEPPPVEEPAPATERTGI